MSRKKAVLSAIAVFALAITVAAGATGTSVADSSGNQLAGTWQATVIPPAPQPPVHSLQVYNADGGWVETSNQDPSTRSAMYGASIVRPVRIRVRGRSTARSSLRRTGSRSRSSRG